MKKIVVIGGGTGNFVVLRGLKKYDVDLSVIVSMADDGGSTGILRDELGVLPPGDVRQCLVALSDSSRLMRDLMNYRFDNGCLDGHSFGNILLSALEKVTGSFEKAVEETGKILNIKGKVIPVTVNQVSLKMILENGKLLDGEKEILLAKEPLVKFRSLFLEPSPKANPRAIDEIRNADLIVFGPGGLYTSLVPNLLVDGISEALNESRAKKVFVVNLMNKKIQTPGFKASDYLKSLIPFLGGDRFDFVVVNKEKPSQELIEMYSEESELVENDFGMDNFGNGKGIISADLLDKARPNYSKSDKIAAVRTLIRHDSEKLAGELMKIVNNI
jgi:uncharacterized cofD-like protein